MSLPAPTTKAGAARPLPGLDALPGAGRVDAPEAAEAWARSGAMLLTGRADGPPELAPGPFAAAMDRVVAALARLAPATRAGRLRTVDGARLLGERAAALGLGRRGSVAPGGSCRLLRGADGWLALNLAREDDRSLLAAWLELERPAEPARDRGGDDAAGRDDAADGGDAAGRDDAAEWAWIARAIAPRAIAPLVERGRSIGLAVADSRTTASAPEPWLRVRAIGAARERAADARPRVVDLSALWAGPLCGDLLRRAGADVIKVESLRRPDGARRGPAAFFDVLNSGKRSVALDFRDPEDLSSLRALLRGADIVIESARPRALQQLGIDSARSVQTCPGQTWVAITGYGSDLPRAGWVAFGDDAAVAAGTAEAMQRRGGEPRFCGDALADPLTGAHAAFAALTSYVAGGGHRVELALRDVTAAILRESRDFEEPSVERSREGYVVRLGAGRDAVPVAAPVLRAVAEAARPLGADTRAVLSSLPANP